MRQEDPQEGHTPVGIVFKGSGFYATDHRSPSGQTRTSASTPSATESKSGEEKSSAPSPETSTPAKPDKKD